MAYLHGSEVSVHGKLRSCNCLIDGRFVLKISDFGLATLTTPTELVKDTKYYTSKFLSEGLGLLGRGAYNYLFLPTELLWVAPELLPLTIIPGTPATQKGDVYSFGIILEEIIVRGGPFEAARQFLEPNGQYNLGVPGFIS